MHKNRFLCIIVVGWFLWLLKLKNYSYKSLFDFYFVKIIAAWLLYIMIKKTKLGNWFFLLINRIKFGFSFSKITPYKFSPWLVGWLPPSPRPSPFNLHPVLYILNTFMHCQIVMRIQKHRQTDDTSGKWPTRFLCVFSNLSTAVCEKVV